MMDKEAQLEGTKGTRETRVKSGQEHVNKAKLKKLYGEEGLEAEAGRAKAPPMGSKEKVTTGMAGKESAECISGSRGAIGRRRALSEHGKAFSNSS